MDILECYDFVLAKAKELEEFGLKVEYETREGSPNKEKDCELPFEKWLRIRVTFEKGSEGDKKLHEVEQEIWNQGISFDTGYGLGDVIVRDWEIDWSFRRKEGSQEAKQIEQDIMRNPDAALQ